MTTSVVMDMNLGENGGVKQSVNGSGRRKTKGSELTQKKNKQPQRGMGVEQLERLRLQERLKKMTEVPSLHPFALPAFNSSLAFTTSSSCTPLPNAGVHQLRAAQPPPMLFHGVGIHGTNLFSTADYLVDPSVIGSSNFGFRFENSKELASIPNYIKCASDGCAICPKKKRIHGGSNACSANQFLNLAGNNTIDSAKTRRQVTEVMSVHRSGGSSMTEYEFFPGKSGRGEDYKEFMRIGTPVEEGSFSSVDLSLKL